MPVIMPRTRVCSCCGQSLEHVPKTFKGFMRQLLAIAIVVIFLWLVVVFGIFLLDEFNDGNPSVLHGRSYVGELWHEIKAFYKALKHFI